jgi:hypothetical protein
MAMRLSTKLVPAILFLAGIGVLPNTAAATIFVFTGTLSGANSVPPVDSMATGSYTATLDDVADSLALDLTFSGLTGGPATAAHIHCCVSSNANGPGVIPFTGFPNATSGTYSNTFFGISPVNVAGIENAFAYFNIHNAVFPGGEIRSQLAAVMPEPETWAMAIFGMMLVGRTMRRRGSVFSQDSRRG